MLLKKLNIYKFLIASIIKIMKKFKPFILVLYFVSFQLNLTGAVITYELSGGRFGDNLLAYCHAKWLSYKYKIPIFYKPFEFSDQLVFHNVEFQMKFNNINKIHLTNKLDINANDSCIYSVPYFSEVKDEHKINPQWIYFKVDWNDPDFKKHIKNMIYPINLKMDYLKLPKDRTSVAVHIRTGGGYDQLSTNSNDTFNDYINFVFPLKFPPISFYIEQIKKISELLDNIPLYVYIFTDDANPQLLIEKISQEIQYKNIFFDFRKQGNAHNKNVLEDFFALTKFDCLIRGQSNFSLMASKISDYKIEISPIDYYRENNKPVINNIEINIK